MENVETQKKKSNSTKRKSVDNNYNNNNKNNRKLQLGNQNHTSSLYEVGSRFNKF